MCIAVIARNEERYSYKVCGFVKKRKQFADVYHSAADLNRI